jgi:hypothetical protein
MQCVSNNDKHSVCTTALAADQKHRASSSVSRSDTIAFLYKNRDHLYVIMSDMSAAAGQGVSYSKYSIHAFKGTHEAAKENQNSPSIYLERTR